MHTDLEYLLATKDFSPFFKENWGRTDKIFENVNINDFFSIKKFEEVLNFANIHNEDIAVFRDGDTIQYSRDIDISKYLFAESYERATVRVKNINKYHKNLSIIKRIFETFFNCKITLNAYFSRGVSDGLLSHADPYHVFAIQVFGEKSWNIGGIATKNVTTKFNPKSSSKNIIRKKILTTQGSALYIPSGMLHSASTENISLHLTVGVIPPNIMNGMATILKQSSQKHSILRSEFEFSYEKGRLNYNVPSSEIYKKAFGLLQHDLATVKTKQFYTYDVTSREFILPKVGVLPTQEEKYKLPKLNADVKKLINEIWGLSNLPIAIYLRGSYNLENSKYDPWDIDIYFIIQEEETWYKNIFSLCSWLEAKHNKLPSIDLNIITKTDIYSNEAFLLKRLLLIYDGVLVKGSDISHNIVSPQLNEELSKTISEILKNIYYKKINRVKYQENLRHKLKKYSEAEVLSLVKLVLRFGMVLYISQDNIFERNVGKCHHKLFVTYPEISDELNILINFISSPTKDKAVLYSCESVFKVVYEQKRP